MAELEFLWYPKEDLTEWFNQVDQFFEYQETIDNQKVSLASFHLEGEVNQWWQITLYGETKYLSFPLSNKFFFLVFKGMILCWIEWCANPLNPVPTGIIPPRTMFSFGPFSQSIRPRRAAFAKMRAVSWKLALDMKLWVLRDALIIPNNTVRWLHWAYKEEGQTVTWEIFEEELWAQFAPIKCEDFDKALSKSNKWVP